MNNFEVIFNIVKDATFFHKLHVMTGKIWGYTCMALLIATNKGYDVLTITPSDTFDSLFSIDTTIIGTTQYNALMTKEQYNELMLLIEDYYNESIESLTYGKFNLE